MIAASFNALPRNAILIAFLVLFGTESPRALAQWSHHDWVPESVCDIEAPAPILMPASSPAVSVASYLQQDEDYSDYDAQMDMEQEEAEEEEDADSPVPPEEKKKEWYEKIRFRGYAQFRINPVVHEAPGSAPPNYAGDSSIAPDQNFIIRRARIIFSGDVSDHVSVYLQTDFASNVPGSTSSNEYAQIRDWYADLYLDTCKVNRFRVGQSKVPYGWEDLQSSSNRVPFDRADGLNSAVRNERDLGVFYYWTPEAAQDLFTYILDENLKGSGNYGVFGIGVYNGQGGSFNEQNDNLHGVARLTYPFMLKNGQIMEASIQGYYGEYAVFGSQIFPGGGLIPWTPVGTLPAERYHVDKRIACTYIIYPQPIGFQTEWNVGRGPALSDDQLAVVDRSLNGGYFMLLGKHDTECHGTFFPYVRWSYYEGGYKSFNNAPYSYIDETEFGCEWQFNSAAELTVAYLITDRTNLTAFNTPGVESYRQFVGDVLRFQCQINY